MGFNEVLCGVECIWWYSLQSVRWRVGVNVSRALPTSRRSSLFPLDARWGPGLGTPWGLGPVDSLILILCLLLTWLQYLEKKMEINKVQKIASYLTFDPDI